LRHFLVARSFARRAFLTVPRRAVATIEAIATTLAFLAIRAIIARSLGFGLNLLLVALILVGIIALATRILFLEAGAALAQHAEIVIRILQIIFGLDAVASELRVARHALVFLKELRGIPALAIVLPVPRLSAEVLAPLSPTTAPAAALSIVDQMPTSLRSNH
jgi:hypothetical protein